MVRNKTLLLIASLVWLIAGFNIVRIGVMAYKDNLSFMNFIYSTVIFTIFWFMVFKKLVSKHTLRIKQYMTEKQYFWKFFDLKSFCIMAFMMTLGITIRIFNLVPDTFIAIFYTGLGISLSLAGIAFAVNYIQLSFDTRRK